MLPKRFKYADNYCILVVLMKQEFYPELKKIENELKEIKILILKSQSVQKKPVKLRGILKGVKFNEKDFVEAKKAVFKHYL